MDKLYRRRISSSLLFAIFLLLACRATPQGNDGTGMDQKEQGRTQDRDTRIAVPSGEEVRLFIQGYIEEEGIPGCAVVSIRDGRLTWSEGFGRMNSLKSNAVNSETVFEVASNSKIIAAYLALRLVEEGMLDLDTPLNDYLAEPWLPDPAYRDSITLRHVLSHSSGLGHNEAGRKVYFSPGSGYYYSKSVIPWLRP